MEKNVTLLAEISNKFTEETLKNIFAKANDEPSEFVKVLGWTFEPASKKGDNYSSTIHRVTINGTIGDKNINVKVVIKPLPRNEAARKTFRITEMFENEINFYSKIIPAIDKFLESKNLKNFLPIPKCYECYCDGQNDFLVFEDIRELGYGQIPRKDVLKLEDCQAILKALARFHAVSFAYKNQHPSKFLTIAENLIETYYDERLWSWYEKLFTDSIVTAKDAISREYKGTPEEKKFLAYSPKELYNKILPCTARKTLPSSIITHGDAWVLNYMIRTLDNVNTVEAILLDFQMARCTTPIPDISNVIYSTTDKEMRDKHFNNLLKYYYDELTRNIALLGTDPQQVYIWDLFMKEVKENFIVGFCFSVEGLPIQMLEESEVFNPQDIQENEDVDIADIINLRPIESQSKRRRLADIVVHAVQSGFI